MRKLSGILGLGDLSTKWSWEKGLLKGLDSENYDAVKVWNGLSLIRGV